VKLESFSGGTPNTAIKNYYDGTIPFIRSGEINLNVSELRISDEGLKNSSAKMVNMRYINCFIWCNKR
jgi:type I restriction enzyme S subunit